MPKRFVRTRKDEHVRARDEGDESLLLEALPRKKAKLSSSMSQMEIDSQEAKKEPKKKAAESDSETEPESDEEAPPPKVKSKPIPESQSQEDYEMLPMPERSSTPNLEGRAPGRIIGTLHPMEDFKKNTNVGDIVTKVVEDMSFVIKEILRQPFAERRHDELIELLKVFRDIAWHVSQPPTYAYYGLIDLPISAGGRDPCLE